MTNCLDLKTQNSDFEILYEKVYLFNDTSLFVRIKKGWYDPDRLTLSRIKELTGEDNILSARLIKQNNKL